jgi:hypothetical protein
MSSRYKILFMVELLNEFYSSNASNDFIIVPTTETIKIMQGHQMLSKFIGNRLIILIKVDSSQKPIIELKPDIKFSFYLLLQNPYFYNVTNVNHSSSHVYYLSNLNGNEAEGMLYLSLPVAAYEAAKEYKVGDIVNDGSADVFEAIKPSDNGNQHPTTESDFWRSKGKKQFVSSQDTREIAGSNLRLVLPISTEFLTRIFRFNQATGQYDLQVRNDKQTYLVPRTNILIDLSGIAPGTYRIEVNNESRLVYVDDSALQQRIFGVLEIHNNLIHPDAFSLLNAANIPNGKTYSIQFASRSVLWKYYARTTDITAINDTLFTFSSPAAKEFVSTTPIPLKEKPAHALTAQSATLGTIKSVAQPGGDMLNRTTVNGVEYFVAEKFLNY